MVSKPPPAVIKCDSTTAFQHELDVVREIISIPETENTWDEIGRAIMRLSALSKGNAPAFPQELIDTLRSLSRPLTSAINSERTRLSGIAVDLLSTIACELTSSFEPLIPLYFPTLLTLCTRTNKVFVSRARVCILCIVEQTHSPSLLAYLSESIKDKSMSLRLAAAETVLACAKKLQPAVLEKEPRIAQLESVIRVTATDASADVRQVGRKIFEAYKVLFPRRVDLFTEPLTPTVKKYLDIKPKAPSQPKQPSRPASAQSSHSVRGRPVPPVFSSSTSALQSKTHARSVSSSEAFIHESSSTRTARRNPTAPLDGIAVQGHPKRLHGGGMAPQHPGRSAMADMVPPNDVPIRARDAQTTVASGGSSGWDANAAHRGPSRPATTTMSSMSRTRTILTTSYPQPQSTQPTAEVLVAATRPPMHPDKHAGPKSGPLRPLSEDKAAPTRDVPDKSGRVVGGARRVPLPLVTDCTTNDAPEKKVAVQGSSSHAAPMKSSGTAGRAHDAPVAVLKDKADALKRSIKGHQKAIPVPRPGTAQAIALSAPGERATDDKPATKERSSRPASSLSQSREKALTAPNTQTSAKPVRGRSASTRVVAAGPRVAASNIKPLPKKTASKAQSERTAPSKTIPEKIPLPPSPTGPALIPLPPSPGLTPTMDAPALLPPTVDTTSTSTTASEMTPTLTSTAAEKTPMAAADADADAMLTPLARALFPRGGTVTPTRPPNSVRAFNEVEQTPISALVASIEEGFLFTPYAPRSPPRLYASRDTSFNFSEEPMQYDGRFGGTAHLNLGQTRGSCEPVTDAFDMAFSLGSSGDDVDSHYRVLHDLNNSQEIG